MKLPQFNITGASFINVGGAVVIVYLLAVLISTVKHNYDMGQQIKSLKGQISLLQDQKSALSDSIAYYQTNSYRDRQARSQLGLQLPGENVVIIPGSQAKAAASPADTGNQSSADSSQSNAAPKSNWTQWMNFLTGG